MKISQSALKKIIHEEIEEAVGRPGVVYDEDTQKLGEFMLGHIPELKAFGEKLLTDEETGMRLDPSAKPGQRYAGDAIKELRLLGEFLDIKEKIKGEMGDEIALEPYLNAGFSSVDLEDLHKALEYASYKLGMRWPGGPMGMNCDSLRQHIEKTLKDYNPRGDRHGWEDLEIQDRYQEIAEELQDKLGCENYVEIEDRKYGGQRLGIDPGEKFLQQRQKEIGLKRRAITENKKMKITRKALKQIIAEEIQKMLREGHQGDPTQWEAGRGPVAARSSEPPSAAPKQEPAGGSIYSKIRADVDAGMTCEDLREKYKGSLHDYEQEGGRSPRGSGGCTEGATKSMGYFEEGKKR